MHTSEITAAYLHNQFLQCRPQEIITSAFEMFTQKLVMSTSFGTGSAVLLHMVQQSGCSIPIIHLASADVTEVNREYAAMLCEWFGFEIPLCTAPDKPATMRHVLDTYGARAILHGIRADQSEERATFRHAELQEDGRFRIYPLLRMTAVEMKEYLLTHSLPIHPSGFPGKKTTVECGLHKKCR